MFLCECVVDVFGGDGTYINRSHDLLWMIVFPGPKCYPVLMLLKNFKKIQRV